MVWSQPRRRRQERARDLLLVSVILAFFSAVLAGRGDLRKLPFFFRTAVAIAAGSGAVLLVVGSALFALQRGRREERAPLAAAESPDGSERMGQEERR